jgi:hypothetical protein
MMAEAIVHNIDDLNHTWASYVYPYTKPILEADAHGRPRPVGTGILVSSQEKQYLLTANHVTAEPPPHVDFGALYTYVPEQLEIVGPIHSIPDPFDLSLAEISVAPAACLKLPQHLAFDVHEGEICLILGFPGRSKSWQFDQTRLTLRASPLSYVGVVLNASETRFSVRMNRKYIQSRGAKIPNIGKLNGISGGGAFVLRNDRPRLAGIVIEYHENISEIVCTSSAVVWKLTSQL